MEDKQRSFIHIEFEEPLSMATKDFTIQNCSPMHLFAVGKMLMLKGEQFQMQIEMQQARAMQEEAQRNKIAVPKPNIDLSKMK